MPLQNVDRLNAREGRPSTARSDRDDPDDAEDFRASFERARDPVREIRVDAFLPPVDDLGFNQHLVG